MKYIWVLCVALLVSWPVVADTVAERLKQVNDADGVSDAKLDPDSIKVDPLFPDITYQDIVYVYETTDTVILNRIRVVIDKAGNCKFQTRIPPVLVDKPVPPAKFATEAKIEASVTQALGGKLEKIQITYGADFADVTGYLEEDGKMVEKKCYVVDDKGTLVVKVYGAVKAAGL